MPWQGTTKQHKDLWQALDQVLRAHGFPAQRLAAMINDDKRALETIRQVADKARSVIDDGTLKRWHDGGPDSLLNARAHKKQAIYEFFERTAQPRTDLFRPDEGLPPGLASFAAQYSVQFARPLAKDLSDLDGNYRIFRPAWSIPALRKERVLVSRLKISTSGGFTSFTEEQDYTDPDSTDLKVKQSDDGGVLYVGGNIVLLGFTRETQGCKMYTAWSVNPIPGDGEPVRRLRGAMMGIAGAGPHDSYPFTAIRTEDAFESIETAIIRPPHRMLSPDILGDLGMEGL
ncbi:hypothetical protein JF290_09680 [Sedimentitalea sp. CAU 1593]|uniref:Uncharacterized protein n=2 Tax=Sedimentitalea arenosa TaxID=2798803 RepID=A0A8J7J7D3_9RHOB|nr:hypothetical protein [Arenibacterium arenosum]